MRILPALLLALLLSGTALAAGETVRLPEPDRIGGMPLMQALAERRSIRNFSTEAPDEAPYSDHDDIRYLRSFGRTPDVPAQRSGFRYR